MLNRKFPLWGTWVPDDMPLRLTLLALPRVNRMEFLAPERGGKMLESVHPSNQVKSPLFPSICSTPGDVSAPSSPRCFLKNTRGGRKVRTRKTEHLDSPGWRLTQGFTLAPSIIHHPPDQARADMSNTASWCYNKRINGGLTSRSVRWPWRAQRWGSPTPSAGSAWSSTGCRGLRAPSGPWCCSSGAPGCHCWGSWCAAAGGGAWPGTPGHLKTVGSDRKLSISVWLLMWWNFLFSWYMFPALLIGWVRHLLVLPSLPHWTITFAIFTNWYI